MTDDLQPIPTGAGAAMIVSAAAGCMALALFALAGDAFKPVAAMFTVWKPTGPLSGVTDAAILVWLAIWFLLSRLWSDCEIDMGRANIAAAAMFVVGLLVTFPPFADLILGK